MDITIRDWTFTHFWVRPVVKIWFHIYHKSVTYSGTEHIDWQKPIIFAVSHQSAFTDALCLILPTRYTNDRFIYPLTRADAFGNNKITDWILTAFHMLPVYRPKDRVDIKKQNDSIFGHCFDILSKNRNLLIHPEGNCFAIKRVRRFKKGLARIALGAESKHNFNLDVRIVPVGINYRELTGARSGIHIQFGEAVSVLDYYEDYREQQASAIAELTGEIESRVRELTVDISSREHYRFTEELLVLVKNSTPEFALRSSYLQDEVAFEQGLIERLQQMESQDTIAFNDLVQLVENTYELLDRHKLDKDNSLVEQYATPRLIAESVLFLLASPVFLYGWINNGIPWVLINKLADSIEDTQFVNSARMASALLIFPLSYAIQATLVWWLTPGWLWSIGYLFSLPLTGILSLKISEKWKEWKQQMRLKTMPRKEKEKLNNLLGGFLSKLGVGVSEEALADTA